MVIMSSSRGYYISKNLTTLSSAASTTAIDSTGMSKLNVVIVSTSVSTGSTLKLQGSIDGTNYVDIPSGLGTVSAAISTNTNTLLFAKDLAFAFIRVTSTSYTDGTYAITAGLSP